MNVILSFEEFRHRLEEEGKGVGPDEQRSFAWLVQSEKLTTEDCIQLLDYYQSLNEADSSSLPARKRAIQK